MFRFSRLVLRSNYLALNKCNLFNSVTISPKRFYSHEAESYDEMDRRMIEFFKRKDLDSWWVRKGLQELQDVDAVPEPEVIIQALLAIRKINDFALALRFLEAIQFKCGKQKSKIWPYILKEIQPTLKKLGIPTPEEMGYDKPELALKNDYLE